MRASGQRDHIDQRAAQLARLFRVPHLLCTMSDFSSPRTRAPRLHRFRPPARVGRLNATDVKGVGVWRALARDAPARLAAWMSAIDARAHGDHRRTVAHWSSSMTRTASASAPRSSSSAAAGARGDDSAHVAQSRPGGAAAADARRRLCGRPACLAPRGAPPQVHLRIPCARACAQPLDGPSRCTQPR